MTNLMNDKEMLEAMIDRSSVKTVLDLLSEACSEKAEHIRDNWQDRKTARVWINVSNRIEDCARSVEV